MSAALNAENRHDVQTVIVSALRSVGLSSEIQSCRGLSGGCIHRVIEVRLADAESVIAKVNDGSALRMFEEEAVSLKALEATQTALVPRVLACVGERGVSVLLMTRIVPPALSAGRDTDAMWRAFGEDLAALHLAPLPDALSRGYGFPIDNHLGATPQPNAWCDDWVAFNAQHRLGHQVRLARERNLLDSAEVKQLERVIARLDCLLPQHPQRSLLHGDLWSGNALPAADARRAREPDRATCAVIDPACSVGDALADIAMMQLFGKFPRACLDAWSDRFEIDLGSEASRLRVMVYQLYHVLNHLNLFGRGYAAQAMTLARRLAS